MININKPIFIIGAGRSGTTIFYNHLAIHPELCWFSNISDRFYQADYIPYLHRLFDLPAVGNLLKKRILAGNRFSMRPSEAGKIYHEMASFAHTYKITEKDRDTINEMLFKKTIEQHLYLTGKERFLSKQTANTQRIRLLSEIFEDALFIHITRDGRAVANSLYNVEFWKDMNIWWLDREEMQRDDIELCAKHWQKNIREILDNKYLFDDRYIEIKYEKLSSDFKGELLRILNFCKLNKDPRFLEMMPQSLSNKNYKWKENFSKDQKKMLLNLLEQDLNELGYL